MDNNAPVSTSERIVAIDVLRGFALLGILVLNIQVMAMIGASYTNPTIFGDFTGWNYRVWWFGHVFFDQKMMTIFSLLFGAGIALMADRATKRTGHSAWLHYRRMFWLLLIGLAHAHLIWFGDILVAYSICGMIVYLMRRWYPIVLFILGMLVIAVPSILNFLFDQMSQLDPEGFRKGFEEWSPTPEKIQAEIDDYRGSWMDQMRQRVPAALLFETLLFALWSFWRAGGLMLVGMACFRWGIFSAERTSRFYGISAVLGLAVGLPVVIYGTQQLWVHDWDEMYIQFVNSHYNYWGSLAVSFAYICILMLTLKNHWMPQFLQRSLAAVGQMALTNYLLQSIIGTLIFYGHGLGLFGSVDRAEQFLIVLAIWLFQLIVSPIWLSRFRFGPFEWLWRSLTYWRVQPFVKKVNSTTRAD